MALTQVTITGTFARPDGQPAAGKLTATLSEQIANGAEIIDPTPIYGILNAAGALKNATGLQPFTLEANDDTGTTPAGSTYTFLLELDSAPVREASAVVPHTAPSGIFDLSQVFD